MSAKTNKEQQLLKYAASGSNSRVENILKGLTNPLKRWLSRDRLDDIAEEETSTNGPTRRPSLPIVMHKEVSPHVDVNCRDENGVTPLILASLNGHRDVSYTLISFSADIHTKDKQGNTALHMAAWQNRSEIVELLLLNGAWPAVTNKEGNTPLHYACQYCPPGKTLTIIKLLQNDASPLLANNAGDTPLDLAIRYNRKEAVAVLVDADNEALKSPKIMIEAVTKGRKEVVEILLEAGMDPNCFDSDTGNMPLHEAVRYFRKEVAALLLSFGAQGGMRNGQNESVVDLITKHPEHRQDDFMKLIREYHGKKPRVARVQLMNTRQKSTDETDDEHISFVHCLLRNRKAWLKNDGEHCSAATKKHPVTSLHDTDPCSYWLIPAPGAYNWVAFDFESEYTLTGIRIYGWGNKKMIYSFSVETATSLSGPWTTVGKYKADLVGPEEMELPPEGQDFKGFYATSQFWRIVIADNYGDPVTAIASIEFYGYETALIDWFKELNMSNYIKKIAEKGYNQLSELAIVTADELKSIVFNAADRQKIVAKGKSLRSKYYPPCNLRWAISPQTKAIESKPLPEFSVMSDPYTVGDLVLVIHGGGQIIGKDRVQLISKDNGFLSRATFTNISISPVGTYTLEVQSASDPTVSLKTEVPITVEPPPKRHSEIDRVFQDFENMINFDI